MHPALNNKGTLHYYMNCFKTKKPKLVLKNIGKWEKDQGITFLKRVCLNPGEEIIIMQMPGMEEICQQNTEYAFQTDTLPSWIHDEHHPNMNCTMTSVHSTLLGRHVLVLVSIMFGISAVYYKWHFYYLLKCLPHADYDGFVQDFVGNISDFSQAEFKGFQDAIRLFFHLGEDIDLSIENLLNFCTVHFKRTAEQIKSNYAIVKLHEQDEWQHMINIMLHVDTSEERFDSTVEEMKSKFRNATDWIDWHLSNKIANCIFPAKGARKMKGFGKDTNGQEGAGRWVKRGYGHVGDNPDLEQALAYLFRQILQVHLDVRMESLGKATGYGDKTRPKKGVKTVRNDKRSIRYPTTEGRLIPMPRSFRRDKKRKERVDLKRRLQSCSLHLINSCHGVTSMRASVSLILAPWIVLSCSYFFYGDIASYLKIISSQTSN